MKKEFDRGNPISIFYSYAPEDENLRNDLDKHLSLLQRNGTITTWHNRQIIPGTDWAHIIDRHLNEASIILLLISPDFLASDYCYAVEMQRALERHKNNEARVIPILLRPVDWDGVPFAHLQCLPLDRKPVTTCKNRDAAFLQIAKGIRDAIKDFSISTHSTTSSDHYRQRLLKTVRSIWITGVLELSLHHTDLLAVNMYEQPDAVDNPWQETVQETKRSSNPLTPGTQIIQIYDDADGDLLILGEPGSGKTTQLLELTRKLLDRAEQDAKHPIPVVFHIASYYDQNEKKEGKKPNDKEKLLADWLIDELNCKYKIPREVSKTWVKNDQILPLLDGLDEAEEKYQGKCIEIINAWKQEHILLPLVICSRFTEYMAQKNRFYLQKAITLQPLTIRQINAYLNGKNEPFQSLRILLQYDSELREVASTPLMLNILLLVCKENRDLFKEISYQEGSVEMRRKQIFKVYVRQMLSRRKNNKTHTSEQVIYWLSLLARESRYSTTLNETIFTAPSSNYFPLGWHRRLCKGCDACFKFIQATLSLSLIPALIGSLILGIIFTLHSWLTFPSFAIWLIQNIINLLLMMSVFLWAIGAFTNNYTQSVNGKKLSLFMFLCRLGTLPFAFLQRQGDFRSFLLLLAPMSIPLLFILLSFFDFLHNFIARFLLCWSGWMLWNYRQFLDYTVERILLRKEGNRYIFIHALLRDYFASLNDAPPT